MANCTKCNKVFTCGCQKARSSTGELVCKPCAAKERAEMDLSSRDLSLELAKQQIQDLRNK